MATVSQYSIHPRIFDSASVKGEQFNAVSSKDKNIRYLYCDLVSHVATPYQCKDY
jgi:hypothetical protein